MIIRSISLRLLAMVGMLALSTAIAPVANAVQIVHTWVQQSSVTGGGTYDSVTGNWNYAYTLQNDSYESSSGTTNGQPIIVDWELPWFSDEGIAPNTITSPTGWASAIETIGTPDPSTGWDGLVAWQGSTATKVLHWYDVGQSPAYAIYPVGNLGGSVSSLSGFGFTSSYANHGAPYETSWLSLPHYPGDPNVPLGEPGTPEALETVVPEPSTFLLFGAGLIGVGLLRKRFSK